MAFPYDPEGHAGQQTPLPLVSDYCPCNGGSGAWLINHSFHGITLPRFKGAITLGQGKAKHWRLAGNRSGALDIPASSRLEVLQ
jgi:hypothetical protein